jgi:hypothetical protein
MLAAGCGETETEYTHRKNWVALTSVPPLVSGNGALYYKRPTDKPEDRFVSATHLIHSDATEKAAMGFAVHCACGKEHSVAATQAGSTLACTCG